MRPLLILALVAAALWLLSLVRLGVRAAYRSGVLTVKAVLGPVKLTLLPPNERKKGRKPAKKPQPSAQPPADKPRMEPKELLALARRALPVVLEAAGRLKRKVRVDKLYLDVAVGGEDPAAAALAFGGVNAAVGMIWPLLEQNFNIGDRRIRTDLDFSAADTAVTLDAAATLTVGQALALALYLAPKLPQILGKDGKKDAKRADIQQKEAV